MLDPLAKTYYIITLRGDRGPFSKDDLREEVKAGDAQTVDQVRNAFGRPMETIADVLEGRTLRAQTSTHAGQANPISNAESSSNLAPYKHRVQLSVILGIILTAIAICGALLIWKNSKSNPTESLTELIDATPRDVVSADGKPSTLSLNRAIHTTQTPSRVERARTDEQLPQVIQRDPQTPITTPSVIDGHFHQDGRVNFSASNNHILAIQPVATTADWKSANFESTTSGFKLLVGPGITGTASFLPTANTVAAKWQFYAQGDLQVNGLAISATYPSPIIIGKGWSTDNATGTIPNSYSSRSLFEGPAKFFEIQTSFGHKIKFSFPEQISIQLQDNRKWSQTLSLRMGGASRQMRKTEPYVFSTVIDFSTEIQCHMTPNN